MNRIDLYPSPIAESTFIQFNVNSIKDNLKERRDNYSV